MKVRKSLRFVLILAIFVVVLLPVAGAAAKGAANVSFAGKEHLVEQLDPGVVTEVGGNVHGRGAKYLGYEESSNPCIQGPSYITSNININKQGKEHVWGDFVIEPEAYEGTWVTKWHNEGDMLIIRGHGTGVFQGMTLKAYYDTGTGTDYIPFTGAIHVPPNAQVQCAE